MDGGLSLPADAALEEALSAFGLSGTAVRYGSGHINDTFLVTPPAEERERGPVILQRMSAAAFPHPEQVMANLAGITEHLQARIREQGGDPHRETLTILRPKGGGACYTDSAGGAWRAFPFIRDTFCLERADTPERLCSAGRAFGRFQMLLADFPAHTLYETIPRFHDTEHRLALLKAAAEADPLGRLSQCRAELDFALARAEDCTVLRKAALPLRVTHNDTKLSNLLFDASTGEALCVIDLDTTMSGLAAHDFGDSIRSGANRCSEEEPDLSGVFFDLGRYEAYTRGFLSQVGSTLTEAELASLPWGARIMTLECGIRFLTDFLEGDVYFRTHSPDHNLRRCRTQFRLVRDMEAQFGAMKAITARCAAQPPVTSLF